MPIRYYIRCAGVACHFNTDALGDAGFVRPPATRCPFCDTGAMDAALRGGCAAVARQLSKLFLLDAQIYREAMERVPSQHREACRGEVQGRLSRLAPRWPAACAHLRAQLCMRATYMIMSESAVIPNRVRAVQYGTDDIFSAMALRRRIPLVLLAHVAGYSSLLDMGGLYEQFASTKQHGYVLSRHPLFVRVHDDASSGYVYSLAQRQHTAALRGMETALFDHIRAAEMLTWGNRVKRATRVLGLVVSMRHAPKLPTGRALCHASFCPPDIDARG